MLNIHLVYIPVVEILAYVLLHKCAFSTTVYTSDKNGYVLKSPHSSYNHSITHRFNHTSLASIKHYSLFMLGWPNTSR